MPHKLTISAAWAVLALLAAGVASADVVDAADASAAGPVNPFARPYVEVVPAPGPSATDSAGRPVLRGVIVAGSNSIANLDGTLLAIGEEQDGYRLESVSEDGATFLVRDQAVTLLIEPAAEDTAE